MILLKITCDYIIDEIWLCKIIFETYYIEAIVCFRVWYGMNLRHCDRENEIGTPETEWPTAVVARVKSRDAWNQFDGTNKWPTEINRAITSRFARYRAQYCCCIRTQFPRQVMHVCLTATRFRVFIFISFYGNILC